jgi:hypothetical protein
MLEVLGKDQRIGGVEPEKIGEVIGRENKL